MPPNKFKPMLADSVEIDEVVFPTYASPKLDGVRCIVFDGVPYSRSLKVIPNANVRKWAHDNRYLLEGFDGELCVGSVTEPGLLRRTTSLVMSHDKVGDFTFWVFDLVTTEQAFDRVSAIEHMQEWNGDEFISGKVQFVQQTFIRNKDELIEYERNQLSLGYEGTMLKDPEGYYKYGRASVKSRQLLKRKPFVDAEFKIIGWEPLYHNANEAKTNELGRTARSSSKSGMEIVPDFIGALICQVSETDTRTFNVGTGFDMDTRAKLYKIRDTLPGQLAKVKYFAQGKVGGIPELPVFLDLRYPEDQ